MERDWEDSNKFAFVLLVQTWLLKIEISASKATEILFQAMRVRKTEVPTELPAAVTAFMAWQLQGEPAPEWAIARLPVMGGIAGLSA